MQGWPSVRVPGSSPSSERAGGKLVLRSYRQNLIRVIPAQGTGSVLFQRIVLSTLYTTIGSAAAFELTTAQPPILSFPLALTAGMQAIAELRGLRRHRRNRCMSVAVAGFAVALAAAASIAALFRTSWPSIFWCPRAWSTSCESVVVAASAIAARAAAERMMWQRLQLFETTHVGRQAKASPYTVAHRLGRQSKLVNTADAIATRSIRRRSLGLMVCLAALIACSLVACSPCGSLMGYVARQGATRQDTHLRGLLWSCMAIIGKPVISALRKKLASLEEAVGHAEQVGAVALIQGVAAALYCLYALPPGLPPPLIFWVIGGTSSVLNAVIRTFETKALAMGEMSLCAPFLALDPVMQLFVGACIAPLASSVLGWDRGEGTPFTPRHSLAVGGIAFGIFALSTPNAHASDGQVEGVSKAFPKGAALICINCVLYSFTYRLDRAAICWASTPFYFACCRLLIAASCIGGLLARRLPGKAARHAAIPAHLRVSFAPFLRPRVAACVAAVCAIDAVYMLSMYRAVSLVSPVLVSAIKRGGGVLVSAVLGSICFGEQLQGRWAPLLMVASGVAALCL